MLQISKDGDHAIAVLGLKSLLAVFKDIIPGYFFLVLFNYSALCCGVFELIISFCLLFSYESFTLF